MMRLLNLQPWQFAAYLLLAGSQLANPLARAETPAIIPTTDDTAHTKTAIDEQIEYANSIFNEIVATAPQQQIAVTTYFAEPRPLAEAVQDASDSGLTIEGFRHGDADHSGGYTMRPGERLEDAIGQYDRDARAFAQLDLEHTEQMLVDAADPAMREDLARRRIEIVNRQEKLANEGLLILGLELLGSALELQKFRKTRPYVRFLEVREAD